MIRLAHRAAGWAFWPATIAATGAADHGAPWGTVITLAAVAGWCGVVWLLTDSAHDGREQENGQ